MDGLDQSKTGPRELNEGAESPEEKASREAAARENQELIKRSIKVLLMHLASRSDNPGHDLQVLLHELISELHDEVRTKLRQKRHLKVVDHDEEESDETGDAVSLSSQDGPSHPANP